MGRQSENLPSKSCQNAFLQEVELVRPHKEETGPTPQGESIAHAVNSRQFTVLHGVQLYSIEERRFSGQEGRMFGEGGVEGMRCQIIRTNGRYPPYFDDQALSEPNS
jgi:hypothetical protein